MEIQMKTAQFKPSDPVAALSFLNIFETSCDSSTIQKISAMWLVPYLILEPAKTPPSHRTTAGKKNYPQKYNQTIFLSG